MTFEEVVPFLMTKYRVYDRIEATVTESRRLNCYKYHNYEDTE